MSELAPAGLAAAPMDNYDPTDPPTMRKRVFDSALNAAQTMQPVTNARHTLRLSGVAYADPDYFTPRQRKEARLTGGSLGRRLRGTWELLDNATGQVLDNRQMTVARIPYVTDDGTIVHRGNEWSVGSQFRLRPGIYTRRKTNNELEAHVNVLPGKGRTHKIRLDPASQTFYAEVEQANIPLINLAKILGATDEQLNAAWGDEILTSNKKKDSPKWLTSLYEKFVPKADKTATLDQQAKAIRQAFESMEFDPDINRHTLKGEYPNAGLATLLATTSKLLSLNRGEVDPDDRDEMANQQLMTLDDLVGERLHKDSGGLRRTALWKATQSGSLKHLAPGTLSPQLEEILTASGLGKGLEMINPAELLDKRTQVTRLGQGGIGSVDAIPKESRSVQPSFLNYVDSLRTPESERAGVDMFLARGIRKGSDGKLYSKFRDVKTGQEVWKTPQEVRDLTVAFPQELTKRTTNGVSVMRGGRQLFRPRQEVDLEIPNFQDAFSALTNLVPMLSGVKGQRVAMASRMLTQALSLKNAEEPLVQSGIPGKPGRSYEDEYGTHFGAAKASKDGRVLAVDQDGIKLQHPDGTTSTVDLYSNFPYARKTYMHQTPLVKPGQDVKAGDMLAHSNFTTPAGTAALGANFKTVYLPYKGKGFEDAVVVSEGAAKRLTSQHAYQHNVAWNDPKFRKGIAPYTAAFPGNVTKAMLEKFDDDGVILPGTKVKKDEPLILGIREREPGYAKVNKRGHSGYTDASEYWHHDAEGVVQDVVKTPKGAVVVVQSEHPAEVGDKISGRYGDKGVISAIIPDHQMPHDEDGNPYELAVNELGVVTRTNPAQIPELILSEIAKRTGKPYKVTDFADIEDLREFAETEARRHGVPLTTKPIDPETGNPIPNVGTGYRFMMKLHHTAESKGQGRGVGEGGYTNTDEPAKGGEHGSKRVSLLDNNAIIAHGAYGVSQDAGAIRGQRSEDLWATYLQGHALPKPKVPMIYRKFISDLQASGVNVLRDGSKLHIMAMNDDDVDKLAEDRELQNAETVDLLKGLRPIRGGLFDEALTGGNQGNRWSKITLPIPLPNPVMEEPIRRVLGLTEKNFREVLAGRQELGNRSGPDAIQEALKRIDVDKELARARQDISSRRGASRDEAIKRLKYLKSAELHGRHPREWMVNKVPVLPPIFRPVSVMAESGTPLVSDANYLYRELMDAKKAYTDVDKLTGDPQDERLSLYDAYKAVVGLADPTHPKLVEKNVKGILKGVFGSSPKFGSVQRRLISSTVDAVGRGVVVPNPELDMDQISIPEDRAWDVYRNFVVRQLRQRGMAIDRAVQSVQDRGPEAREALNQVMSERPVLVNRAPVLHKLGIMAFRPTITKNKVLEVSPLIVSGFNMDFDGDAVQYHVPVSSEAVQEALERMLPSRNLIQGKNLKKPAHAPGKEYAGGLFLATRSNSGKQPKVFRTRRDVLQALQRGELQGNDPVTVLEG
jgi:DNA-directed RNA polymerase beta subunit